MIERLLAAESALARDDIETAGQLFAQIAEADPRNAIAVVGLARIAQLEERRDDAKQLAQRALAIDPEEAAARRLLRELLLGEAAPAAPPVSVASWSRPPAPGRDASESPPAPSSGAEMRPTLLDRIRRWFVGLGRRS